MLQMLKALVLKGQEKEDDKEDLEEQVHELNIDEIQDTNEECKGDPNFLGYMLAISH